MNLTKYYLTFLLAFLWAGALSAQELIFHSGFEPGTAIVNQTTNTAQITGTDQSVAPPNNWTNIKNHPTVGRFEFQYQDKDNNQQQRRGVQIVTDPTGANRGRVLKLWATGDNRGGGNARVQANAYDGTKGITEYYERFKIYLPSESFAPLKASANGFGFLTIIEIWNDKIWRPGPIFGEPDAYPYRMNLNITKAAGAGQELYLRAVGEVQSKSCCWGEGSDKKWEEVSSYALPLDTWLDMELYIKEGNATTGKLQMAVTPAGGTKQMLFDITGWTRHPKGKADGITHANPMKLYTSLGSTINTVVAAGDSVKLYWDDFELWQNKKIEDLSSGNVTVRARGTTGEEKIVLRYNDQRIGDTIDLVTSYQEYKVQVNNANGNFKVAFVNDSGPRAVYVDWLEVGTTKREAESRATNTGAYGNGRCGGGTLTERMACNGYIDFGTTSDNATAGGIAPGTYQLLARHSGKALDVQGKSAAQKANVQQWQNVGGNNQQWQITPAGNGYYTLKAKHSDLALAVDLDPATDGGKQDPTANGVNIFQYGTSEQDDRLWKIEPVGQGYYKLTNKYSGKVLDVSGVSKNNGANVHQWTYVGGANQQWQLEAVNASGRVAAAYDKVQLDVPVLTEPALRFYPNPTSDIVTVSGSEDYQVTFYNLSGRKVMQQNHLKGKAQLDISHLRPGLYLVRLHNGTQEVRQRIIIE